eukprot:scaffold2509_cov131-Skeletonema_dohrnii-CCMP3373.AAC.1
MIAQQQGLTKNNCVHSRLLYGTGSRTDCRIAKGGCPLNEKVIANISLQKKRAPLTSFEHRTEGVS